MASRGGWCTDCRTDISERHYNAERCVGCQTERNKARWREAATTPEAKARSKAYAKEYDATPEVKARRKARRATPEAKARQKAYDATAEVKSKSKAYQKAYQKAYRATPEFKARKAVREKARRARVGGVKPHRWWPELAERQGGKCGLCGKALRLESDAIQVDHIEPESLGGPTTMQNLQAVHPSCNGSKSNSIVPQNLVLL